MVRWGEAVECHRQALALKPDCAEAYNSLGNALREQGEWNEAVACYRRALELKPEPLDLNLIIDNAMAYTSTQVREKNITIRLDIATAPPHILADRESLQQILIHLLQNASSATHIEGAITLRIQLKKENGSF